MTKQNRVDPWGQLVRSKERGALLGNRGELHRGQEIIRPWKGERWIACRMDLPGPHPAVFTEGHYSQLFSLDEATAFAAGHRLCWECRRNRFVEFKTAWCAATPDTGISPDGSIDLIDAHLHQERAKRGGDKVTYQAEFRDRERSVRRA